MSADKLRERLITTGSITLILLVVWALVSRHGSHVAAVQTSALPHSLDAHPPEHRAPIVDGALQPDLISDDQALSMFMLMAAHPEDHAGRAFVHHIFNRGTDADRLDRDTIEAIRVAAVDYSAQLKVLYASVLPNLSQAKVELLDNYRQNYRLAWRRRHRAPIEHDGIAS